MKKAILSLFLGLNVLTIPGISLAQGERAAGTSEAQRPAMRRTEPGFIAKGFKVGLSAVSFEIKSKSTFEMGSQTFTDEYKYPERVGHGGISVGYEHLRRNAIGFDTDLTLYKHSSKEHGETGIMAAAINMNYGFIQPFSLYGGLNLSRITQGSTLKGSDGKDIQPTGIGLQLGGAYTFNSQIKLNLGYTLLSQKAEYQIDGKRVGELEYTESSLATGIAFVF